MSAPQSPPSRERSVGEEIAQRYVLERKLGEGGMGTVWAAQNKLTYRRVAMKFLRTDAASDSLRQRFLREARAAGRLSHPNVCEVIDVQEVDGTDLVLVLELLDGQTLARYLEARGRLSMADTAGLLLPVVSAIGTAHTHGDRPSRSQTRQHLRHARSRREGARLRHRQGSR